MYEYLSKYDYEQEVLEEGRVGKSLLLALSLVMSTFTSCSNNIEIPIETSTPIEIVDIEDYSNIDDEQTIELLKKYFTKNERKFILSRLTSTDSSRYVLASTTTYKGESEIIFYENEIKRCSKQMGLPLDFVRGLTVIHELCHVLTPGEHHNSVWLNCFESKITEYCWDSIDDLADYYGDDTVFETPDELIEYVVTHKTKNYRN